LSPDGLVKNMKKRVHGKKKGILSKMIEMRKRRDALREASLREAEDNEIETPSDVDFKFEPTGFVIGTPNPYAEGNFGRYQVAREHRDTVG
jgi:hypothetical protein